jgi:RecA/RadA recombinase
MKSSVVDPYDKRRQQPPRRQPEGTPRHCHTIPQPVTARQLLRNQRASHKAQRGCLHLIPPGGTTTCCPGRSKDETNESSNNHTDDWLRLTPGLYQLVGPAGSGKSQIALTACLAAAAECWDEPNSGGSTAPRALFISLKGQSNMNKLLQRLQQMANATTTTTADTTTTTGNNDTPTTNSKISQSLFLLQRILTRSLVTADDLYDLLSNPPKSATPSKPFQQQHHPQQQQQPASSSLRLVVLDSIADIFRAGNHDHDTHHATTSTSNGVRRSAHLAATTARLLQLWADYIPVLVLNQVSGGGGAGSSSSDDDHHCWYDGNTNNKNNNNSNAVPACGLQWAHAVHTSFLVGQSVATTTSGISRRRYLRLIKSATRPTGGQVEFVIQTNGVERIES